jgi:formate-nitrite transporter family protein
MTSESIPPLPRTVETGLTKAERKEVAKRLRPTATILHETIRAEGEVELHRPAAALGWSALAAGLSMGFSLLAMGLLQRSLPAAPWRPLVVSLGYSVGFVIVILGRQQLFTENTLTPVLPLFHNRDRETLARVLKLWGIVLAANLTGALLFALVAGRTSVFDVETRTAMQELAVDALAGGFWLHLFRGIFSGWLIALMVWLLPSAETSRVFIIVSLTYLIGVAHLSHVIAGSVEGLYAVVTGAASLASYLVGFLIPVALGNMVGGIALVAALTHAEIAAEAAERESANDADLSAVAMHAPRQTD